jgi:uncharacterized membrane protein YjfL (UPF0719 family)
MKKAWKDSVLTGPTATIVIAFFAFGVTMLLQPYRYQHTPSYANLIQLANLNWWGSAYLIAALLLAAYLVKYRQVTPDNEVTLQDMWLPIVAHTFAGLLSSVWLLAFVIRYATDSGTTIVNVVSWSVFTMLITVSALRIDEVVYGTEPSQ